jgi:hypothetical protein
MLIEQEPSEISHAIEEEGDKDALVCLSAAKMRRLVSAAFSRDDNRLFFVPLTLLRSLELAGQSVNEAWMNSHNVPACGTDDGRVMPEPRKAFLEALCAIRAVETDEAFAF